MNPRLRVLFVCAMNKQRSATAEELYRRHPSLAVRSAGVRPDARHRITEEDLCWADIIFAMERVHQKRIMEQFRDVPLPHIEVLDIPDEYDYMDPQLQELLRLTIDPEINALLGNRTFHDAAGGAM